MTASRLVWGILILIYVCFTYWYTNTEGPLTEEEIAEVLARGAASANGVDVELLENFMRSDTGNQFVMINSLDLNETPGGEFAGQTPEDLLGHYMEYMYPELFKRASHPIFAGQVFSPSMDLLGIEGAENWDTGALMRYRSRRDLLEIATNPVFADRHDHKLAALTKTIAYPVEISLSFADPRFHLGAILLIVGLLSDKVLKRKH